VKTTKLNDVNVSQLSVKAKWSLGAWSSGIRAKMIKKGVRVGVDSSGRDCFKGLYAVQLERKMRIDLPKLHNRFFCLLRVFWAIAVESSNESINMKRWLVGVMTMDNRTYLLLLCLRKFDFWKSLRDC
jgi:hypothetical protein